MKTRITEEDLIDWKACYWENYNETEIERLRKLLPCTPEQLIEYNSVHHEDKLWVLLREDFFSLDDLRLMSCDFIESVAHLYKSRRFSSYNKVRKCINAARRFQQNLVPRQELEDAKHVASNLCVESNLDRCNFLIANATWNMLASMTGSINRTFLVMNYSLTASRYSQLGEEENQIRIVEKYLKKEKS